MKPNEVDRSTCLIGSEFRNSETENVVSNLVFVQNKMNPEQWTPFTWEDYCHYCTHSPCDEEKQVLTALVNGGKPVWNTSAVLSGGYLNLVDGKYHVTDKLIEALEPFKR